MFKRKDKKKVEKIVVSEYSFASVFSRLLESRRNLEDEVEELRKNQKEESTDLTAKVDEFIKWYYENSIKGNYLDNLESKFLKRMRNLIEKVAVWYELRYPEYEVNRLMRCCGQESTNVNDVMFRKNPYLNELFDENSDVKELEWSDFYNISVFMKSLPREEKNYFKKPNYKGIFYLTEGGSAHLHLTRNGFVEGAEYITEYTNSVITDEELKGLNVKQVIKLFKEKGIKLPDNNELEAVVKAADKWIKIREGILDCAMYRIIERGENRIGPRRAFIFAKEFDRNIDIPMMYAVDRSDPGLRLFVNEYIKAGGSKDLECYVDYFSNATKKEELNTMTVQDLILNHSNNAATFYTPEEDKLHQRLINAISTQIDYETVRKEKVKQLRLERKLAKSKRGQQ